MEKKNLDWENMGFSYMQTDKRYVANYKGGKWDDGALIDDANIVMNECAGVLQYSQSVTSETNSSLSSGTVSRSFTQDATPNIIPSNAQGRRYLNFIVFMFYRFKN